MEIKDISNMPDKVHQVNTKAYRPDGTVYSGQSDILCEHRIQVYVNGELVLKLVCTPGNLQEFILGRLKTTGYISSIEEVEKFEINEDGSIARVKVSGEMVLTKEISEEATCCTDNKVIRVNPTAVMSKVASLTWKPDWIFELTKVFKEDSKLHKSTFGTHSCYLMTKGEVVFSAEDLGRHNAMDKVIGYALLHQIPLGECIVFTTGRVPVDMVTKAISAGIPVLVSKAVPTIDAVEMAKEYGLTLICKAWPDQFEVF